MAQTKPTGAHGSSTRVDPHHGNNVAAWTSVAIMMLGFLVMSVAVGMTNLVIGIIGAVIVVAGAVVGKVLTGMGMGAWGKDH